MTYSMKFIMYRSIAGACLLLGPAWFGGSGRVVYLDHLIIRQTPTHPPGVGRPPGARPGYGRLPDLPQGEGDLGLPRG